MECWTQNGSKTRKNCQNVKFNGYDKQTDDFLETFPNFMTLTEEERYEFFQTLHAAKLKLENSGVTVKPFFGTVHDRSWNNSDSLRINGEPGADNEAFASPRPGTDAPQSKKPASFSVNRFGPVYSENSVKCKNSEKTLKGSKIYSESFQENPESVLGTNDSLESFGFEEKEVEVTSFNSTCKNNALESAKKSIISSLSYEILNKDSRSSLHRQEKEDTLKITGTKLKVQVTLTSGDKERMKVLCKPKKLQIDNRMPDQVEDRSGKSNCLMGDKKMGHFDLRFGGTSTDSMDDAEVEDLLNVENDSTEDFEEEKNKSPPQVICKRSFDEDKKNVLGKVDREKKEVNRHSLQKQSLPEKEEQLINAILGNDKQKTLPRRSKTAVIIEKVKPKKEQIDNKAELRKTNSNASKKSSQEPKGTPKVTQQILKVRAAKGAGSDTHLEKQETGVPVKDKARLQLERQLRVEKLRKSLQKRESLYRKKLKKKDELKAEENNKSGNLGKKSTNEEEVQTEENPTSTDPDIKMKERMDLGCDSKKKTIAIPCTAEETKEAKKEKIKDFVPTPAFDLAPVESSVEENEKCIKVSESKKENVEKANECVRPFKEGKVVFVDDNVIEKIRSVILDLEKKAKADDCTENEYLILVVDYIEYLSAVMATLFEDRINNSAPGNQSVRFDEENLAEIQQSLRVSTPTTEDESENSQRIKTRKKHKRRKHKKPSFIRCLKKIFHCGKNKKLKKIESTSSDSSS